MTIHVSELQLIGFMGKAGSGKDTVAQYIHETFENCWGESFAGPLKEAAAAAFGIDIGHFHAPLLKEEENPYWKVSPREIAQFMGTEMFRNTVRELIGIGNEFWIARLEGKLTGQLKREDIDPIYEPGETILITDVRFQNEYDWILQNGGMIFNITRDNLPLPSVGIPGHTSESGIHTLQGGRTWHIRNDFSFDILYKQVEQALKEQKLIKLIRKQIEPAPAPETPAFRLRKIIDSTNI